MSSRRRVRVVIDDKRTTFSFSGWRAVDMARAAGLRPTYNGVRGWTADYKRLANYVAYLEYRNVAVEIVDPAQTELFAEGSV